jgi:hypothetical protein
MIRPYLREAAAQLAIALDSAHVALARFAEHPSWMEIADMRERIVDQAESIRNLLAENKSYERETQQAREAITGLEAEIAHARMLIANELGDTNARKMPLGQLVTRVLMERIGRHMVSIRKPS